MIIDFRKSTVQLFSSQRCSHLLPFCFFVSRPATVLVQPSLFSSHHHFFFPFGSFPAIRFLRSI